MGQLLHETVRSIAQMDKKTIVPGIGYPKLS